MAKKDEPKERLLRLLIPPLRVGNGTLDSDSSGDGWELVTASTTGDDVDWAVWRGYFDLSGIVEQQETLFTIGPVFQEADDFTFVTTKVQGSLRIWDMITQEYITDETFNGILAGSGSWIAPGMMGPGPLTGAPYELQDIHYGNFRNFQYGPITSLGVSAYFPVQTRNVSWGAGAATAGSKLYVTRAVPLTTAWTPASLNEGYAPATAVVVPTLIMKEADLQYIERLRRSYVTQPTVD